MGGFEGGDEGGFWDVDTTQSYINKHNADRLQKRSEEKKIIEIGDSNYSIKAYAKVNIFFKITGYKNDKYTFLSRIVRVDNLYNTISFVPCACHTFTIDGCDEIPLESNSIYKAYKALNNLDVEEFFCEHKVVVTQRIPSGKGLGGSSSNAASFLCLIKEICNLILCTDELVEIGRTLGTSVPFFIYNYSSATLSNFGEIVEPFEEEVLNLELFIAETKCETGLVYKKFKDNISKNNYSSSFLDWKQLDSRSILNSKQDSMIFNDMYESSLNAYPSLKREIKNDWFFSSGSTFFRIFKVKNEKYYCKKNFKYLIN